MGDFDQLSPGQSFTCRAVLAQVAECDLSPPATTIAHWSRPVIDHKRYSVTPELIRVIEIVKDSRWCDHVPPFLDGMCLIKSRYDVTFQPYLICTPQLQAQTPPDQLEPVLFDSSRA